MKLVLKQVRERAGMTQQQVADAIGIKIATYRTWEQGGVKLTLENAFIISEVLGCTPNDLCDWYATHPRENAPALAMDETALIDDYRSCTPEQKRFIALAADNARGASLKMAERPAPGRSESGRGVA